VELGRYVPVDLTHFKVSRDFAAMLERAHSLHVGAWSAEQGRRNMEEFNGEGSEI
jgi:hypothetical protein